MIRNASSAGLCGVGAVAVLVFVLGSPGPLHGQFQSVTVAGGIPEPKTQALVIGIDAYDTYEDLDCAGWDAVEVARTFADLGFETTLLTDHDDWSLDWQQLPEKCGATKPPRLDRLHGARSEPKLSAEVLARELREFLLTEGTDVQRRLIWYSGHGESVRGHGFLVGADAPQSTKASFLLHTVPIRDLAGWSRMSDARHVLVVLDSCFAGTVFETRHEVRPDRSPGEMLRLPARQFLTSGSAEEEVCDDGTFRREFVRAIEGRSEANGNRDQVLTFTELGLFLSARIPRLAKNCPRGQTPQYGALLGEGVDAGNFFFRAPATGPESAMSELPTEAAIESWSPVRVTDCETCPPLVVVPGTDEMPSFAMSAREITFDEWDECYRSQGAVRCKRFPKDFGWGRGEQPVVDVSQEDALEYVAWLKRESGGRSYRLPTEAEWRHAAGVGKERAYWFGSGSPLGQFNCRDCGQGAGLRPLPVGSIGLTHPWGLFDLAGNVWEWLDCGDSAAACGVAGGSWANGAAFARADVAPILMARDRRSSAVGFRVVRGDETPERAPGGP